METPRLKDAGPAATVAALMGALFAAGGAHVVEDGYGNQDGVTYSRPTDLENQLVRQQAEATFLLLEKAIGEFEFAAGKIHSNGIKFLDSNVLLSNEYGRGFILQCRHNPDERVDDVCLIEMPGPSSTNCTIREFLSVGSPGTGRYIQLISSTSCSDQRGKTEAEGKLSLADGRCSVQFGDSDIYEAGTENTVARCEALYKSAAGMLKVYTSVVNEK